MSTTAKTKSEEAPVSSSIREPLNRYSMTKPLMRGGSRLGCLLSGSSRPSISLRVVSISYKYEMRSFLTHCRGYNWSLRAQWLVGTTTLLREDS